MRPHPVAARLLAAAGTLASVAAHPARASADPPVVHPDSSCAGSSQSGGPVAQATVLARAQVWVDANVPYTQNCASLPGGYYREDCSGFISMAWELTTSLVTTEFNPAYDGGDTRFQSLGGWGVGPFGRFCPRHR
jgi:hypothetical protein